MNKDQMKKNLYAHVQLRPPACRLDENGIELKPVAYFGESDRWAITEVSDAGVTISHPSGHVKTLGYDHIQKFTSDEARQGVKRGFLTLHVQLFVQGNAVHVEPNARPGEPVLPRRPEIVEHLVESNYPVASGIQQKLAARGYRVGWCRPERVRTLVDVDGWEVVVEPIASGGLASFRTKGGLILIRGPIAARAAR